MDLLFAALAVYKVVQILDLFLTKEPMPWVKVLTTLVMSYVAVLVLWTEVIWLHGLVVATIAGIVHSLIRMITLMGDMARAKSLR
jgi:hypothetical protein